MANPAPLPPTVQLVRSIENNLQAISASEKNRALVDQYIAARAADPSIANEMDMDINTQLFRLYGPKYREILEAKQKQAKQEEMEQKAAAIWNASESKNTKSYVQTGVPTILLYPEDYRVVSMSSTALVTNKSPQSEVALLGRAMTLEEMEKVCTKRAGGDSTTSNHHGLFPLT